MALLYLDSFDHYATADAQMKWASLTNSAAGSITVNAADRAQGHAVPPHRLRRWWQRGRAGLMGKTLPVTGTTAIIGVALNASAFTAALNLGVCAVYDGATVQSSVPESTPTAPLSVLQGTSVTGTMLGLSAACIQAGIYNYLEYGR
jgi:hypothetical protein